MIKIFFRPSLTASLGILFLVASAHATLRVGAGKHDITGSLNHVTLVGYGDPFQRARGLHSRLYSRAFVIEEVDGQLSNRIAFVSADLLMISQIVKLHVVEELKKRIGAIYSDENVMLTATHTHSSPGGYSEYGIFSFLNRGFDPLVFNTIVEGIVESILEAHRQLTDGKILINDGTLSDASVNRSPKAYLQNDGTNPSDPQTNQTMTLLKLVQTHSPLPSEVSQKEIGMINWFAVHQTSMSNKNQLVSSDNKGYASYQFEQSKSDGDSSFRTSSAFVAAFANSEEGDVSPNIWQNVGPDIEPDIESEVNFYSDRDKVRIIGDKQFRKATELYNSATEPLEAKLLETSYPQISYRHLWVEMPGLEISPQFIGDGTHRPSAAAGHDSPVRLCAGALGESFAAGAPDGLSEVPGFKPGLTTEFPADLIFPLRLIRSLMHTFIVRGGNPEDQLCHDKKPIFMATGKNNPPWTPNVLPFQIFKLGTLAIIAVPSELSTMSGAKIRQLVLDKLRPTGVTRTVIAGLANSYSLYVTTPEEYSTQHYEGAATLFGPNTLAAYQMIFSNLADSIVNSHLKPSSPKMRRPLAKDITKLRYYQPGVLFDTFINDHSLGTPLRQPENIYRHHQTVTAIFRAADPRNELHIQGTHFEIQKWSGTEWFSVAHDSDPDTRFTWSRDIPILLFDLSRAQIEWDIPEWTETGKYRIQYYGKSKSILNGTTAFRGNSNPFWIQEPGS